MFKAYKYRIYPTNVQIQQIEQTFGVCRLVYNMALHIKMETWKYKEENVSAFDLMKQLTGLKKESKFIKDVDSQSLKATILNMDNAYQKFFKGDGFPKFKRKHDNKQSFQAPCATRRIDFDKQLLTIPKIKNIPIVVSRRFTGDIKTITISKTSTGKYFASILVDNGKELPSVAPIEQHKTLGIDMGIKDLFVTSDGIKVENPKHLNKELDRIKHLQRKANKKKLGSNNRKKAYLKVAKLHEKVKNRRIDILHKLTTGLVRDNQATTFCMEDLSVSNMMKNHKLAKSIADVSWYEFKRQMDYKCKWSGKNLIVIGRFEPSSKTCSDCGHKKDSLMLNERDWTCIECGVIHDRDINAAINIKFMGLEKIEKSGQGLSKVPLESLTIVETVKKEDHIIK